MLPDPSGDLPTKNRLEFDYFANAHRGPRSADFAPSQPNRLAHPESLSVVVILVPQWRQDRRLTILFA